MNIQNQPSITFSKPTLRSKLKRRVKQTYQYDTRFWLVSLLGLWATDLFFLALTGWGLPTGHGRMTDLLLFMGGGTILIAAAANLAAVLLALTGLPAPRLYISSLLASAAAVLITFRTAEVRWDISITVAVFSAITGMLAGFTLGILARRYSSLRRKTGLALLSAVLCAALVYVPLQYTSHASQPTSADLDGALAAEAVPALHADDPSLAGSYSYSYFTYGSGTDQHRAAYGKDILLKSESVDASSMIKSWSGKKKSFWGFDASALPVNGRVWMPEGNGPFSLVLMVHGNHLMEDYSDEGYAYLGELLASRGFIAVSVDENFLNFSPWSGIPSNDMKVRAWMLLKHLQQIDLFAADESSPLFGKVDFNNIGLIGHSRGGQAVAMAADPLRWFTRGKGLSNLDEFHIRSVIAIAPTDKQVDNNSARLSNMNYLSIQGSQDGDVNDFYGDRQYNRVAFDSGSEAFKSTIYIEGANHSQFNTSWGHYDVSMPAGILLSRSNIMDASEQRQIAKVYVSAFLEATLHQQTAYRELFRDYRTGLSWLPDTSYYNQYGDAHFSTIADFNEDFSKTTIARGGSAKAVNADWMEETAKDREDNNKGNRGVVITWKPDTERDGEAAYMLKLPTSESSSWSSLHHGLQKGLMFSMSNMNYTLMEEYAETVSVPEISVELQSSDGSTSELPLSDFMPVLPLPASTFTVNEWLEDKFEGGKYKNETEAVFQTYRLDFAAFEQHNPEFHASLLSGITFHLGGGPGKIMFTEIGLYQE